MVTRVAQGEPILLTTSSSPSEPHPASSGPPTAGGAHLDRMEADVKALQQQAVAMQNTLQQLQATEGAGSGAALGSEFPLVAGAWGLGVILTAFTLVQFWQKWQGHQARMIEVPDEEDSRPSIGGAGHAVPPVSNLPAAAESEFADASDSDWGVSHSIPLDGVVEFDLKAAANEVARVRKTLAQRRELRAQQREEDALRLRELAAQAQHAAEVEPRWSDSRPLPEVLDVTSDWDVAQVSKSSAPVPFWQMSSRPAVLAETRPASAQSDAPETAHQELAPVEVPLPSFDNAYAVKLALARESAAVELWDEARELIHEVMEANDPALLAQARAVLANIEQREHESRSGT